MRLSIAFTITTCTALTAIACGGEATPEPVAPAGESTAPTVAPAGAATTPEKPGDDPSRSQINIADEILRACGIKDTDAHFAFDSAKIQGGDQPVLNQLATCFTTGALAGKGMRLVGHADPRGDHEYNMVLGGKRSDSVKDYLMKKSVPDGQIETTSRGDMDASGTDEVSWIQDRRVDVVMAN